MPFVSLLGRGTTQLYVREGEHQQSCNPASLLWDVDGKVKKQYSRYGRCSSKNISWLPSNPSSLTSSYRLPPPKFNSSPLKSYGIPIGKDRLPTTIFQGRVVKLRGCSRFCFRLPLKGGEAFRDDPPFRSRATFPSTKDTLSLVVPILDGEGWDFFPNKTRWWLNQPRLKHMSQNGFIFPNFRGEHEKIFELPTTQKKWQVTSVLVKETAVRSWIRSEFLKPSLGLMWEQHLV